MLVADVECSGPFLYRTLIDRSVCSSYIDMQKISKGTMKETLSLTNVSGMKLNFFEAEKLCTLLNASLASFDQLFAAWEAGLNVCV